MKIYLVSGSWQEYDDYMTWDLCAFNSESRAEKFAEKCRKLQSYGDNFHKIVDKKFEKEYKANYSKSNYPTKHPSLKAGSKEYKKYWMITNKAGMELNRLNEETLASKKKWIEDNYNPPQELNEVSVFIKSFETMTGYRDVGFDYEEIELIFGEEDEKCS
jgi:hypothetical protein